LVALLEIVPWLVAMSVMMAFSGFFSASEAALFCLRWQDRRELASGNASQRMAVELLNDPDRLLSAVLFWNLVINVAYFTSASIAGIQLERGNASQSVQFGFTVGSLLLIIFCSEMLPKSLAVLRPKDLASVIGIPVATAVRIVDPIMPSLRAVNLYSRRLLWPKLTPESYLEISDLERAIAQSTSDEHLLEQEQAVLRGIVSLSDTRVDEWMRPRRQFRVFRPPVSLADLNRQMTPSGYLFVTEHDNDEVALALNLCELSSVPDDHLERLARPVAIIPWCATVADAMQTLTDRDCAAAAVVNEMGETIGILTMEDIYEAVFTDRAGRTERLLNSSPIQQLEENLWRVSGLTNLRRLARHFSVELPASRNVTLAGMMQELLERVPRVGDTCDYGPFRFHVVEVSDDAPLLIQMHLERPIVQEEP
jgi:CBS domain containing-hemolysin-like protein